VVAAIDTALHSNGYFLTLGIGIGPIGQVLDLSFMHWSCWIHQAKLPVNQLHLYGLKIDKSSPQDHAVEIISTKLGDRTHNCLPKKIDLLPPSRH
jgi:hypothetical protein